GQGDADAERAARRVVTHVKVGVTAALVRARAGGRAGEAAEARARRLELAEGLRAGDADRELLVVADRDDGHFVVARVRRLVVGTIDEGLHAARAASEQVLITELRVAELDQVLLQEL